MTLLLFKDVVSQVQAAGHRTGKFGNRDFFMIPLESDETTTDELTKSANAMILKRRRRKK